METPPHAALPRVTPGQLMNNLRLQMAVAAVPVSVWESPWAAPSRLPGGLDDTPMDADTIDENFNDNCQHSQDDLFGNADEDNPRLAPATTTVPPWPIYEPMRHQKDTKFNLDSVKDSEDSLGSSTIVNSDSEPDFGLGSPTPNRALDCTNTPFQPLDYDSASEAPTPRIFLDYNCQLPNAAKRKSWYPHAAKKKPRVSLDKAQEDLEPDMNNDGPTPKLKSRILADTDRMHIDKESEWSAPHPLLFGQAELEPLKSPLRHQYQEFDDANDEERYKEGGLMSSHDEFEGQANSFHGTFTRLLDRLLLTSFFCIENYLKSPSTHKKTGTTTPAPASPLEIAADCVKGIHYESTVASVSNTRAENVGCHDLPIPRHKTMEPRNSRAPEAVNEEFSAANIQSRAFFASTHDLDSSTPAECEAVEPPGRRFETGLLDGTLSQSINTSTVKLIKLFFSDSLLHPENVRFSLLSQLSELEETGPKYLMNYNKGHDQRDDILDDIPIVDDEEKTMENSDESAVMMELTSAAMMTWKQPGLKPVTAEDLVVDDFEDLIYYDENEAARRKMSDYGNQLRVSQSGIEMPPLTSAMAQSPRHRNLMGEVCIEEVLSSFNDDFKVRRTPRRISRQSLAREGSTVDIFDDYDDEDDVDDNTVEDDGGIQHVVVDDVVDKEDFEPEVVRPSTKYDTPEYDISASSTPTPNTHELRWDVDPKSQMELIEFPESSVTITGFDHDVGRSSTVVSPLMSRLGSFDSGRHPIVHKTKLGPKDDIEDDFALGQFQFKAETIHDIKVHVDDIVEDLSSQLSVSEPERSVEYPDEDVPLGSLPQKLLEVPCEVPFKKVLQHEDGCADLSALDEPYSPLRTGTLKGDAMEFSGKQLTTNYMALLKVEPHAVAEGPNEEPASAPTPAVLIYHSDVYDDDCFNTQFLAKIDDATQILYNEKREVMPPPGMNLLFPLNDESKPHDPFISQNAIDITDGDLAGDLLPPAIIAGNLGHTGPGTQSALVPVVSATEGDLDLMSFFKNSHLTFSGFVSAKDTAVVPPPTSLIMADLFKANKGPSASRGPNFLSGSTLANLRDLSTAYISTRDRQEPNHSRPIALHANVLSLPEEHAMDIDIDLEEIKASGGMADLSELVQDVGMILDVSEGPKMDGNGMELITVESRMAPMKHHLNAETMNMAQSFYDQNAPAALSKGEEDLKPFFFKAPQETRHSLDLALQRNVNDEISMVDAVIEVPKFVGFATASRKPLAPLTNDQLAIAKARWDKDTLGSAVPLSTGNSTEPKKPLVSRTEEQLALRKTRLRDDALPTSEGIDVNMSVFATPKFVGFSTGSKKPLAPLTEEQLALARARVGQDDDEAIARSNAFSSPSAASTRSFKFDPETPHFVGFSTGSRKALPALTKEQLEQAKSRLGDSLAPCGILTTEGGPLIPQEQSGTAQFKPLLRLSLGLDGLATLPILNSSESLALQQRKNSMTLHSASDNNHNRLAAKASRGFGRGAFKPIFPQKNLPQKTVLDKKDSVKKIYAPVFDLRASVGQRQSLFELAGGRLPSVEVDDRLEEFFEAKMYDLRCDSYKTN